MEVTDLLSPLAKWHPVSHSMRGFSPPDVRVGGIPRRTRVHRAQRTPTSSHSTSTIQVGWQKTILPPATTY